MNKTEQAAYEWLKREGHKNIVSQGRETPDFMTDKGSFEVKRLVGRNTIIFTGFQIEKLKDQKATILVFRDGEENPTGTFPSSMLKNGATISGFRIVLETSESVKLSKELVDTIRQMKIHPRQPDEEIIEKAVSLLKAFRDMKTMVMESLRKDKMLTPEEKTMLRGLFDSL